MVLQTPPFWLSHDRTVSSLCLIWWSAQKLQCVTEPEDARPFCFRLLKDGDGSMLIDRAKQRSCASCVLHRFGALLHDSTAARVGALFQLLVQDTTAQDFGLPSSAIRLKM